VSVVSADITISGKLFHTFTILGAKENFLKGKKGKGLDTCYSATYMSQTRES